MNVYDLAILGSGPGGYIAGLYASRLKLKTCVIEEDLLGGTCLNRGCIPTKAMINSASILSIIKDAPLHGIIADNCRIDFQKILTRRDEVVLRLRTGIETLLRANGIDVVKGRGRITSADIIEVNAADGSVKISANSIMIATGSTPAIPKIVNCDESDILSSDGVLRMGSLPKSMLIVGGGAIGCEFASLFNALGVKISMVELCDRLIPSQSREISKKLETLFRKRGIEIFTSSSLEKIEKGPILKAFLSGARQIEAEKALICIGRSPNTDDIGLEAVGIERDGRRIVVDDGLRTSVKNIYAIGDCINGPQLAHKASYDGMLACDNIAGGQRRVDYGNIPNGIYTDPEIASVGLSEDEAKKRYADVKIAKFPYLASGKAYLLGRTEGFVKIIGDSKGYLIGAEIFGQGSCDLIGEMAIVRAMGIKIEEFGRVVHPHPTLSEILQEAAGIFSGRAIHTI